MAQNNEDFLRRVQELRELAKEELVLGEQLNKNLSTLVGGYAKLAKLKKDQYNAELLLRNVQNDIKKNVEKIAQFTGNLTPEQEAQKSLLIQQQSILVKQAEELELTVQKAKLFTLSLQNATNVSKALTSSIANGIGGALKGIARITGIPTSISDLQRAIGSALTNMDSLDKSIRSLVVNFGGGTYANETFRRSLQGGASDALFLGSTLEDLINVQASLAEKFSRNVIISSKQFADVAAIAKGTSLGFEGAAEILEKYDSFGIGITNTYERLDKFTQNLQKTGLNTGKVLQTVSANLKNAQAYNFRNGIEGLQKMVIEAQRLKFDVSDTFRFAEKLFTPEGAIETAAELQVLGGAFSRLADPFQLLFKGRNDLEGLQKDIIKATSGIAQRVGDEFKIPALELQRLRIVAEKTGLNFNNLTESALQFAKRDYIGSQLNSTIRYNEELSEMVKDLAQIENGVAKVNIKGVSVAVRDLSDSQVKTLQGQTKSLREIAAASQTFGDRLKQVGQTIQLAFLPLVEKFNNFFNRPEIVEKLKNFGDGLANFIGKVSKPLTDMLNDPNFLTGDGLQENIKQFITTAVKVGMDTIKPLFKEAMPYILEGIKEIIVGSFDFLQGMIVMKLKSMVGAMVKGITLIAKESLSMLKFLPFIGDLISIASGIKRLSENDIKGGLIDIGSGLAGGVANLLTGGVGGTAVKVGIATLKGASVGADIYNVGRDLGVVGDKYNVKKAQDLTYFPGQKPLLTIPGAGAYELSSKDAIYARDTTVATNSAPGNINVRFSGTIKLDAGGVSREMKMELLDNLSRDLSFQRDLLRSLTSNKELTYSNLS